MRYLLFLPLLLASCSPVDKTIHPGHKRERITRLSYESLYPECDLSPLPPPRYPWDDDFIAGHRRISKEHFRCKGSSHNAPRMATNRYGEKVYYADCGGIERHSLPLKEGEEYIYPVLIELLNYLQEMTRRRVVITCGHRCPIHNTYADKDEEARYSKHMIGAEVDFYVEGFEERPMDIIELLFDFYRDRDGAYSRFLRYHKSTNVKTPPWYNKEVFIKLYKAEEGRDLDTPHTHPYLALQVRFSRDEERWVSYTWHDAYSGYMRW